MKPAAWRWPLTDAHGAPTDSFGVTTNPWLASQVVGASVESLYGREVIEALTDACRGLKSAFGDPMTRRALGGHNEDQQAAILNATSILSIMQKEEK